MRGVWVSALLVVALVPSVAAEASVDRDEHTEADMVSIENRVAARVNESRVGGYLLEADLGSEVLLAPEESATAPGLETILAFLAALSLAAPEAEPAADHASTIYQEGAGAGTAAHATESDVAVAVAAHAGAVSASASEATSSDPTPQVPTGVEFAAMDAAPESYHEEPAIGEDEPAPAAPVADGADVEPQGSADVAPAPLSLPAVAAATLAVATVSGGAGLVLVPGWRTALLKLAKRLGALALFSRIAQEDILNHERRAELLEYIRNNPGERIETARRALGFSNGSMHYHLRVLSGRDLVRVHREGMVARLFPAGPKIRPAPYVPTIRRKYLEALTVRPGITQRELATLMGVSERMVSYHVGTLAEQGFVSVQAEFGRKRLFLQGPLPA